MSSLNTNKKSAKREISLDRFENQYLLLHSDFFIQPDKKAITKGVRELKEIFFNIFDRFVIIVQLLKCHQKIQICLKINFRALKFITFEVYQKN